MTIPKFDSEVEAKASTGIIFHERQLVFPEFEDVVNLPSKYRLVFIGTKKHWMIQDGYGEVVLESIFETRLNRVIKAAGEFWHEVECCFQGYAESGYTDPECGLICLANWNDKDRYDRITETRITTDNTPSRVCALLEKLGVEIEWSDEWLSCEDCCKIFRSNPDSMGWSPSGTIVGNCSCLCTDCIKEDPEEYLEGIQGKASGMSLQLNLSEHGYVQVYDGAFSNKEAVATRLREIGISDFIQSQEGTVWVPESYRGRFKELEAVLEQRDLDLTDYLSDLHDALTSQDEIDD